MEKIELHISPEYEKNAEVRAFIESLPHTFQKEGTTLYDKRNVIKSFNLDASDKVLSCVVVKRYKRPSLIQRIVYGFFRESKAKRAFYNAAELCRRSVDTPREIAYIEQRTNGLLEYGYYISASDDAPPIYDKLIAPDDFDRKMADDFAAFVANLHMKGILHHDLNSTNVLYHTHNDGHYTFSVIDINRMFFLPVGNQPSLKECFDNLTRFTGRMDLFEYVLRSYAQQRGWNVEATAREAIAIKNKHDEQWRRRKALLRKLKPKKQ